MTHRVKCQEENQTVQSAGLQQIRYILYIIYISLYLPTPLNRENKRTQKDTLQLNTNHHPELLRKHTQKHNNYNIAPANPAKNPPKASDVGVIVAFSSPSVFRLARPQPGRRVPGGVSDPWLTCSISLGPLPDEDPLAPRCMHSERIGSVRSAHDHGSRRKRWVLVSFMGLCHDC